MLFFKCNGDKIILKVIRKGVVLFLVLITNSCGAQSDKKQTMEGSWAPVFDAKMMEDYIEVYYTDSEVFYYFGGMGIASGDYRVEKGRFSTKLKNSDTFKEKSDVITKKDTLIFRVEGISFKYYRVHHHGLGDFLDGKIDKETYEKAFEDRLMKW